MKPAYSKDLRERAIKYILEGNSYASTGRKYEISGHFKKKGATKAPS